MSKENKETAEQKLLKLIETSGQPAGAEPQAKGDEVAEKTAAAVRGTGLPAFHMPSFLKETFGTKSTNTNPSAFGLKEVNKLLLVSVAGLGLFFVYDFFTGMKILEKNITFSINSSVVENSSVLIPPFKALSVYLSPIEVRNIFQPFEKKAAEETAAPVAETKKIDVMAAKLKLVGVSWLDSAESASVMIEDTESGTTYFGGQGEKIKDMTIKTIFTDRVVLTYEGEEVIIKL